MCYFLNWKCGYGGGGQSFVTSYLRGSAILWRPVTRGSKIGQNCVTSFMDGPECSFYQTYEAGTFDKNTTSSPLYRSRPVHFRSRDFFHRGSISVGHSFIIFTLSAWKTLVNRNHENLWTEDNKQLAAHCIEVGRCISDHVISFTQVVFPSDMHSLYSLCPRGSAVHFIWKFVRLVCWLKVYSFYSNAQKDYNYKLFESQIEKMKNLGSFVSCGTSSEFGRRDSRRLEASNFSGMNVV